ncbi:MAG: 1,4-dihydroxy-6-naphthoate synthase [Candidatus Eremiobacteraeota bacterium]|nr:1,4-dihydroxy-6-naphthoate synthase [Candidatus Eremiobacteraeota bacterium]
MTETDVRPITLAYSPCPNDTYIFAALTNGLLEHAPAVRVALEDVEALNSSALKGDYELTKVSYGAIPDLADKYRILRAGGALGHGCGPLLLTKPGQGKTLDDFKDKLIAIPGERTTAFLLLRLALGLTPHIIQMRFDLIVEAVQNGTVDAGLIIHESRFTYKESDLQEVIDLGDWWEQQTGLPIPLGAIMVRNDLDDARASELNEAIRASLRFAREHESQIIGYVRQNAAETSEDVMRKHIELYVNEYSDDIGEQGIKAVAELFKRAHEAGFIPALAEPRFV